LVAANLTAFEILSSYKNTTTFQARAVLINAGQANAATVISPECFNWKLKF